MSTIPAYMGSMILIFGMILPVHYILYATLSGRYREKPIQLCLVLIAFLLGLVIALKVASAYLLLYAASAYVIFEYIIECIKDKAFNLSKSIGCLFLTAPIIFCFLYIEVGGILLTRYMDIIYLL